MVRKNNKPVEVISLGERQAQVEEATANWRAARDTKFAADQEFEDAIEKRETAITLLNQDIAAFKATCGIGDQNE